MLCTFCYLIHFLPHSLTSLWPWLLGQLALHVQ